MEIGNYVALAGTAGEILNIFVSEDNQVILKVRTIRNVLRGQPYDLVEYSPNLVREISVSEYAVAATRSSIAIIKGLGAARSNDCARKLEKHFKEAFIDG